MAIKDWEQISGNSWQNKNKRSLKVHVRNKDPRSGTYQGYAQDGNYEIWYTAPDKSRAN